MPKIFEYAQSVLPWYVNGSLSESERAHMALLEKNSDSFRRLIAEEQQFKAAYCEAEPPEYECVDELLAAQSQAFTQLQERINHDDNESGLKNLNKNTISDHKILAVAASFVLCVSAASLFMFIESKATIEAESVYQVLTTPTNSNILVGQIVFDRSLPQHVIQELLATQTADVISGPSVNGLYRIRLNEAADIDTWRVLSQVVWAEIEAN